MEPEIIRLFVIEDHPVIIAGLKNHFRGKRDKIDVTGSASGVAEALTIACADDFDLFIVDLWLDHGNPEEGITVLRSAFPEKPIIIYTSENSVSWQQRMIKAGVKAYIQKSARRLEIKTAIEIVAKGGMVLPKAIEYQDQRKFTFGATHDTKRLTPNQIAIIRHIASGLTLKETAQVTGSSESTVEKTLMLARSLFKAKTTVELISILKDGNII